MLGRSDSPGDGPTRDGEVDTRGFDELVRQGQAGDRQAMDRVLEILRPYLEQLAHPYADPTRPVESTGDLLQESCLRAWQKLETFEGGSTDEQTFVMFRSWIGQIVRRLGLNTRRDQGAQRRKPQQKMFSLDARRRDTSTTFGGGNDAPSGEGTPSENVHASDMAERVQKALDEMSNLADARIVRLRFFQGLQFTEIAGKLNLNYDHVLERYHMTMGRLERVLGRLL